MSYADKIDASIEEDNASLKYVKGQEIRRELKNSFKYELVFTCDMYFNTLESERQSQLSKGRAKAYVSELESLNERVASHPVPLNYLARGVKHFMLGNLDQAESDLRKCLELNPNAVGNNYPKQETVVLAWILEEQGKIKEALETLNRIRKNTYDTELPVLKAIVQRKSGSKTTKKVASLTQLSDNLKKDNRENPTIKKNTTKLEEVKTSKSELRSLFKLDSKNDDSSTNKSKSEIRKRSRNNK